MTKNLKTGARAIFFFGIASGAVPAATPAEVAPPHWAFVAPARPTVPFAADSCNVHGPIDAFVLDRLQRERLTLRPPAPRSIWLRRVSFALTGLPPTPQHMEEFEADGSPQAAEMVVSRLLDSPAFGEHLARRWLDLARYADSYGRHEDTDAYVWPWRDWVINAFNQNLPYDQFIIWQTAGDLLPSPSRDQMVATTFNRLAQQSNESGSDEVEFRYDQVADRVKTNSMAFLGLTLDCARCHDHKFDPISQREYWQMAAFFDNIEERGVYSQYCPHATPSPSLPLYSTEQEARRRELQEGVTRAEQKLDEVKNQARSRFESWWNANGAPRVEPDKAGWGTRLWRWLGLSSKPMQWDPRAIAHYPLSTSKGKVLRNLVDPSQAGRTHSATSFVPGPRGKAIRFNGDDHLSFGQGADFHRHDPFSFAFWLKAEKKIDRGVVLHRSKAGVDDGRGYEILIDERRLSFALSYFFPGNEIRVRTKEDLPRKRWVHLTATYDGSAGASGMRLYLDGVEAAVDVLADALSKDIVRQPQEGDIELEDIELQIGGRLHDMALRMCSVSDFWIFNRALSPLEARLLHDPAAIASRDDWFPWFLDVHDAAWQSAAHELKNARAQLTELMTGVPEIMVMKERAQPRRFRLLIRGDYRTPGEFVEPETPSCVLAFPNDLPRNRLGLAAWMVSPENPLTARVAVNRFWQMFFGSELVATPEDFGTRGEKPSHSELLNWLAVDFRESGWDVKRLCRQIALSGAFAQASAADPEVLARDPDNRLLSRGPSQRLDAEEIRDQALASSGLLAAQTGGPPVRPYLPARIYRDSGLQQRYEQGHHADLYRRSLYSFWRRTLPPPELVAFDAPTREFCLAHRTPTETPAQALVLLDAPQFVEAARVMAESLVRRHPQGEAGDSARVGEAFIRLISRNPSSAEQGVLSRLLTEERTHFAADPARANQFLRGGSGEFAADGTLSPVEVAATAMVVRTLLGHEEALYLH